MQEENNVGVSKPLPVGSSSIDSWETDEGKELRGIAMATNSANHGHVASGVVDSNFVIAV